MAVQRPSAPAPVAPVPSLSDADILAAAERHLAGLTSAERLAPSQVPVPRAPRLRRFGRRAWGWGVRVSETLAVPGRLMLNPRRVPGRWLNRVRLWHPLKTLNAWKLALLVFATGVGFLVFWRFGQPKPFFQEEPAATFTGTLFGGALGAFLASVWNDLFRCPWLSFRIRRQIRRRPASVLHDNLDTRPVRLLPDDQPIEIALRTDLFDELLPGVLTRDRKDIQIIVGEPGAGKTTAIVSLCRVLAQLGIVPVLVPLRAKERIDLVDAAREQFKSQIDRFVRSGGEADALWRWLYHRRRVAILTDDIDQIGPDGERGYILRQTLEEATTRDLPIIVTARPAGVPAGVAASAISLGRLDEKQALRCVERGARGDPAFNSSESFPYRVLEDWIGEGRLAEVPFYLEMLTQLAAVGRCPKLPDMGESPTAPESSGRYRRMPDGRYEWNPLWVRFLLLESFYAQVAAGRVRSWTGIEAGERRNSLNMLEGAALGTLAAASLKAKVAQEHRGEALTQEALGPKREEICDFLSSKDRELEPGDVERLTRTGGGALGGHRRVRVSAHEAADTGERLRILDRDPEGGLQFRHRIMQAYLAGSRLAVILRSRPGRASKPRSSSDLDWVGLLLDPHHPEKLTAHMAVTFAAMCARVERDAAGADENGQRAWCEVAEGLVRRLLHAAGESLKLPEHEARQAVAGTDGARILKAPSDGAALAWRRLPADRHASLEIDPRSYEDPEKRTDPDDALVKLATAAQTGHAIGCGMDREEDREARSARLLCDIAKMVKSACYATRWTKLEAIEAMARLGSGASANGRHGAHDWKHQSWKRIWEFARDEDYKVRQAAAEAITSDAYNAFAALMSEIDSLILRASARSALGLPLASEHAPGRGDGAGASSASSRRRSAIDSAIHREDVEAWDWSDIASLRALGCVLPAIVSGLREDPDMHSAEAWQGREAPAANGSERPSRSPEHRRDVTDVDYEFYAAFERDARSALEHLVALSFQGGQHQLEDALARGFKGDAMRHAHGGSEDGRPRRTSVAGPGWVASNRRMVLDICLRRAESWYARLLLNQALALYTIAGANRWEALDALGWHAHRGREHHPLAQRATRLARRAALRARFPVARWHRWIWDDEGEVAGRREATLNRATAQLAADVALLLDLNEGSTEDCQHPFGGMRELPHCLSVSRDRKEIVGKGCPPTCGWNFCPHKQPPPDEPNAQRGLSRAFCRQQRRAARWHRPPWQPHIKPRSLMAFWREMERRART